MNKIEISGRLIGPDCPSFIIAEAGVNHNGSLELALQMVDVAVEAGVDAIKFQTFIAEKLLTSRAPKAEYQIKSTGVDESQLEMIKRLELKFDDFAVISQYCNKRNIIFLSTPFDEQSADFLETLGMPAFKMASGELTNLQFQAYVARKGKPMIVSTGMSTLDEIAKTMTVIKSHGNPPTILLHCTSNYPTPPQEANLRAINTLAQAFGVPAGYSDHTEGFEITSVAVALGACVLEKHFTLDRNLPGPDHKASLEPTELKALVQCVRKIESALGTGEKKLMPGEVSTAAVARKSLHLNKDVSAGHILLSSDLIALRPGTGISPADTERVVGRRVKKTLAAGSMLEEKDLD